MWALLNDLTRTPMTDVILSLELQTTPFNSVRSTHTNDMISLSYNTCIICLRTFFFMLWPKSLEILNIKVVDDCPNFPNYSYYYMLLEIKFLTTTRGRVGVKDLSYSLHNPFNIFLPMKVRENGAFDALCVWRAWNWYLTRVDGAIRSHNPCLFVNNIVANTLGYKVSEWS